MRRSTPPIIAMYGPNPTLISKNVIPKIDDGNRIKIFLIELISEIHIYANIIASIPEPKDAPLSPIPAKATIIIKGYSKIVINVVRVFVIY